MGVALGLGFGLALTAGCGDDERTAGASGSGGSGASAGSTSSGGGGGAAGALCQLGTMYPGVATIDPDAPVYQDKIWSQDLVTQSFADGKKQSSKPYLAYKAAREQAGVLDCAFCACGCAQGVGHKSAIDCFKDMHGFG